MLKTVSTLALLVGAAPVLAQAASVPSAGEKQPDPNKIVCERYEETGSRLGVTKVCRTVREWEDQRRADRTDLERAQRNTGVPSSN